MATQRIYALFPDVIDAERAIGALEDHGIPRQAIGVAARRAAEQPETERVHTQFTRVAESDPRSLVPEEPIVEYRPQPGALPPAAVASTAAPTSAVDTPANVEAVAKEGLTTTTPQDAAAGAAVGTGVGLVAGILAAAAALTIPGVGLILGGGVLASALGAAAATTAAGAVAGGVAGYLRDMGMPERAADNFADRLHEGDYLVTVDADSSQYDVVRQTCIKYNAVGVDINVNAAGETMMQAWGNDPGRVADLNRRMGAPAVAPAVTAAPGTDPLVAQRVPLGADGARMSAVSPTTAPLAGRMLADDVAPPARSVQVYDNDAGAVPPVVETADESMARERVTGADVPAGTFPESPEEVRAREERERRA